MFTGLFSPSFFFILRRLFSLHLSLRDDKYIIKRQKSDPTLPQLHQASYDDDN